MASMATTLVVTLLLLVSASTTSVHDLSAKDRKCQAEEVTTVRHPFTRLTKGVKLQGGFMEIVHEEKCTLRDVRLTCRSLRAFIFVLDAEYRSDPSEVCKNHEQRERKLMKHRMRTTQRPKRKKIPLRGNYLDDNAINPDHMYGSKDLRISLNRRCSGHQHCRFNLTTDHPGANYWSPGALRLKYACIPETAVRKYCNVEIKVPAGVGGYIRSPGYPSYYPGGNSCGWIFRSVPGQRIVLTFHDLNIRSPESDGSCVDVVRVRDNGHTLFEDCGTAAGVKVVSNGDQITLDLVASSRFYPARGFLVQYQVLGCTDVIPPAGSYISNLTQTSRTFLCKPGTLFPDTKERKRIVECKNGKWNESVDTLPSCVATSAVILKTESDHNRLSSLSGDNILGGGVRIGRGEDAVATGNGQIMDSAQSAMMKQADYVVDVVLPTVLIALLFVGNAIIVYIIFQYRKRKLPAITQGEEMALRNSAEVPQV